MTFGSARMRSRSAALGLVVFGVAGCHTDMWVQPKQLPQSESTFFRDGKSSRPQVPGTVAVGQPTASDPLNTGRGPDGKLVARIPFRISKENILRGQERFNIYCSPCHGRLGDGNGMIAQRGLALRRKPANYHVDRLRKAPDGHFFNVITNGRRSMPPYKYQVVDRDRWAIVAYVRALQRATGGTVNDVPEDKRAGLK